MTRITAASTTNAPATYTNIWIRIRPNRSFDPTFFRVDDHHRRKNEDAVDLGHSDRNRHDECGGMEANTVSKSAVHEKDRCPLHCEPTGQNDF